MIIIIDIDCKKDKNIKEIEPEVVNSIHEVLKKNRNLMGYKLISSDYPSRTIQFGRL